MFSRFLPVIASRFPKELPQGSYAGRVISSDETGMNPSGEQDYFPNFSGEKAANFVELRACELRRIPLLGTWVNKPTMQLAPHL